MTGAFWHGTATARAGVAGNPSDALGGAALAVPVDALRAVVELRDAPRLRVRSAVDDAGWASVEDLSEQVSRLGHDGADRLVTAAIVTLWRHLAARDIVADGAPFEVVWRTDIPRSVGLAGSSALVVATLRALSARWSVQLPLEELARLALDAERAELGIAAGWMDRAVQCSGAPTLVDQRRVPGAEVPDMRVIRPTRPVELVVAWDDAGAAPSGRLHGDLRARFEAGEPVVRRAVDELVEVARLAADALESGDLETLAASVERSCRLRAELGALDECTAALVAAARASGGVATSAGSGGAVLVVPVQAPASQVASELSLRGVRSVEVRLDGAA